MRRPSLLPGDLGGLRQEQSVDTLCASFADLHEPQTVDGILVSSPYTEVIAAMVYGFGTIALPRAPMRQALAQDVAHRLAAAHRWARSA